MKDIWESNAKTYSNSFKEPPFNEIRELAYLQGVREYKQELYKKFKDIPFPDSPSNRVGFYERGFREGAETVLRLLKE